MSSRGVAMIVSWLAIVSLWLVAAPALQADAEQSDQARGGSLDSYCSGSGDYCTEIRERNGRIKFEIRAFAEYFDAYKVCVKRPDGKRQCKESKLHRAGDLYKDRIDWRRHFDGAGSGRYKVVWRIAGGVRLGDPLFFKHGNH